VRGRALRSALFHFDVFWTFIGHFNFSNLDRLYRV
jgi:hypothetical protein